MLHFIGAYFFTYYPFFAAWLGLGFRDGAAFALRAMIRMSPALRVCAPRPRTIGGRPASGHGRRRCCVQVSCAQN